MKFKKDFLIMTVCENKPLVKEISSVSRWSINYRCVFEYEGKYYETRYSVGATEIQDEEPYEYADAEIECPEVYRKEIMVIVYVGTTP